MRLTAVQLRILNEAEISRRRFLKLLGSTAGAMASTPISQAAKLTTSLIPNETAYINFYPDFSYNSLSEDLGVLFRAWKDMGEVVGLRDIKVEDLWPYGQFHLIAKIENQDPRSLANKWRFERLLSHDQSDENELPSDIAHMASLPIKTQKGKLPKYFASFKKSNFGIWEIAERARTGKSVKDFRDLIKFFNKEVVKFAIEAHEGFLPKKYFDEKGLKALEEAGINTEELIKEYDTARNYWTNARKQDKLRGAMRGKKRCATCDELVPPTEYWSMRGWKPCEHYEDEHLLPQLSHAKDPSKQLGRRFWKKGKFRNMPGATVSQRERSDLERELWDESFEVRLSKSLNENL